MVSLPPPPRSFGRDTARRRRAREALVDVLWDESGTRRLPREADLVDAIEACDRRDLWWVCEASDAGPLYLLPTREWIRALARFVDGLSVDKRGIERVLEVGAGDGFLSLCLQRARPRLHVVATDDHSWAKASARMTAGDASEFAGVAFSGIRMRRHRDNNDGDDNGDDNGDDEGGDDDGIVVEKSGALAAVKRHRPDLAIVSWAPPGLLVERTIRAPVKWVLDIGVDGDVTGNGTRTWRFHKELLDGSALETRALCRLDARPKSEPRNTRVTLYYGKTHREHGVDRGVW